MLQMTIANATLNCAVMPHSPVWTDALRPVLRCEREEIEPCFIEIWRHYRVNFPAECDTADATIAGSEQACLEAHRRVNMQARTMEGASPIRVMNLQEIDDFTPDGVTELRTAESL